MSRTYKFTLAAALVFTVGVNAVHAQEVSPDGAKSLSSMMKNMAAASANSNDIGSTIENRIKAIMQDMQSSPTSAQTGPVTIDEIDRLNRAAERERTELEFEKARTERSQLEIERLLALYEAVKALEEDKLKEAQAVQEQMMLMAKENDNDPGPDPSEVAFSQDQKNLPRIDSISGIAGVFTAEAEFGHSMKTLNEGDKTLKGFVVAEIKPDFVLLKGPSGNFFELEPQAPVPPTPPQMPGGQGPAGDVIDLSKFPMAQF